MVGKTKLANKSERHRMDVIKNYCGCLPCLLVGQNNRHATIQHVVEGMKRLGHEFTYGSCLWHHMRVCDPGHSSQQMIGVFGPSLAAGKRTFQEWFKSERLLVKTQDYMLNLFDESPWPEFSVPRHVAQDVKRFWLKL